MNQIGPFAEGPNEIVGFDELKIGHGKNGQNDSGEQEGQTQPGKKGKMDVPPMEKEKKRNGEDQDGKKKKTVIDRRQALEGEGQGRKDGTSKLTILEIFMEIEERQGDQSGTEKLEVGDMVHVIVVESENQAAENAGRIVSGQAADKQKHGIGGEQEGKEKHKVVGENGVFEYQTDGKRQEGLGQKMLGEAQGIVQGMKDRGIEEMKGIGEHGVLNPGHDPSVEKRISGIPDGIGGVERQRIELEERTDQKEKDGQNPGIPNP